MTLTLIRPAVLRDASLALCFWCGYVSGLIRGFTPMLIHRLPLVH